MAGGEGDDSAVAKAQLQTARSLGVLFAIEAVALLLTVLLVPAAGFRLGPLGAETSVLGADLVLAAVLLAVPGRWPLWAARLRLLATPLLVLLAVRQGEHLRGVALLAFALPALVAAFGRWRWWRVAVGTLGVLPLVAHLVLRLWGQYSEVAPLAAIDLRLRGSIGAAPATALEGEAGLYRLTLPPGFHVLAEAARPEPGAERWAVLPERDAHLTVVLERMPGVGGADLDTLPGFLKEQAEKRGQKLEVLSEQPLEGPYDGARLLRLRVRQGERVTERVTGVFARGDLLFRVTGFSSPRSFATLEPDFVSSIKSFSFRPPERPPIPASVIARVEAASALVLSQSGTGSGFLVRVTGDEAFVVTNSHVLPHQGVAPAVHVVFPASPEPKALRALVEADDPVRDLALLRVRVPGLALAPLPLRRGRAMKPGTTCLVAGYPYGMGLRAYGTYPSPTFNVGWLLHADAEATAGARLVADIGVNPGNSGGPAVDVDGVAFGVTVSHFGRSETSFLVPVEELTELAGAPSGLVFEDRPARTRPDGAAPVFPAEVEARAAAATVLVRSRHATSPGVLLPSPPGHLLVATDLETVPSGTRDGTTVVFRPGTDSQSPRSARVLRGVPALGLTLLSVEPFAGAPEPLPLALAADLPITSPLELVAFRLRDDGALDSFNPRLEHLKGLLSNRIRGKEAAVQAVVADVGVNHGASGGPLVTVGGRLAGFVVRSGEAGHTNVTLGPAAERLAELTGGALRGGAVRWAADGLGACFLELYLELDDPLQSVRRVGLELATRAELPGEKAGTGVPAGTAEVRAGEPVILKVRPASCATGFLSLQLYTEDAQGRRRDDLEAALFLAPTGKDPDSQLLYQTARADPAPAQVRDWLATPFVPPADWSLACDPKEAGACVDACAKGDEKACFTLGRTSLGIQTATALGWLRKSCEAGLAIGCTFYGRALARTWRGYYHPEEVFDAFRRGCNLGSGFSCRISALVRTLPLEPPGDQPTPASLLAPPVDWAEVATDRERGCDKDDGPSCTSLGEQYLEGQGVQKDAVKATGYFERACGLLDANACTRLGAAYLAGTGGKTAAPAAAYELYSRACQGGLPDACLQAAEMQVEGQGAVLSIAETAFLYSRACQLGEEKGCGRLQALRRAAR